MTGIIEIHSGGQNMKTTRSTDTLLQDGLIRNGGPSDGSVDINAHDTRSCSVIHVLLRLDETDYQCVRDNRVWFLIPRDDVLGWCLIIPPKKSNMIYLSPHLDDMNKYSLQECRLIVAHEIMHLVLGHTRNDGTTLPVERENEAWAAVNARGFGSKSETDALQKRLGLLQRNTFTS